MLPLAGIRVLDFSTLLPGPMAGLFLVEAGAEHAAAVRDPHVIARKIFDRQVSAGAQTIPALPVPIDPALRDPVVTKSAPRLGADSGLVGTGG